MFNKNPGFFLLGLPAKGIALSANQFLLCDRLLIEWIHSRPPLLSFWYQEIFRTLPMERLTAVVRGDRTMFEQIWWQVMRYLPTSLQEIIFIYIWISISFHCLHIWSTYNAWDTVDWGASSCMIGWEFFIFYFVSVISIIVLCFCLSEKSSTTFNLMLNNLSKIYIRFFLKYVVFRHLETCTIVTPLLSWLYFGLMSCRKICVHSGVWVKWSG